LICYIFLKWLTYFNFKVIVVYRELMWFIPINLVSIIVALIFYMFITSLTTCHTKQKINARFLIYINQSTLHAPLYFIERVHLKNFIYSPFDSTKKATPRSFMPISFSCIFPPKLICLYQLLQRLKYKLNITTKL